MSYFYLFILLFITVYIALTNKHSYFKFNKNLVIAALIATSSLMLYKTFLSDGSLKLANQKQSLQIFLDGDQSIKDKKSDEINGLVQFLINKDDAEAGELYILARQMKNINEYIFSEQLYKAIYEKFGNELDGDIISEYAQVSFISNGRKFKDPVYSLLKEALSKNPNNPSALTLQGLAELEKNNQILTIELWTKALPFLSSEKEKSDLKVLIDAVKKRKNQ